MPKARGPGLRVFFDIDGTLLSSNGAGRAALSSALLSVFGTVGGLEGYHFHGKTDPQIVLELMTGAGLPRASVDERLSAVWPVYLSALERELERRRADGRVGPLPGVVALLEALEARREVALGLLTGNIEEGARLKLAAAGLGTVFEVGGYGSDAEEREEIARIAVERGRRHYGAGIVLVVGDTPADIACARAVGGRSLAVATGRHGAAELEAAGAHAVMADLRDTERVMRTMLSLGEGVASFDALGRGGV